MKKILQDLSYEEIEALILSLGERKFRAGQVYLGLMQGKKISELPVSSLLRERLIEQFEDEPVKIYKTYTAEGRMAPPGCLDLMFPFWMRHTRLLPLLL